MRKVGSIFKKQRKLFCQILKHILRFQQLSVLLAEEFQIDRWHKQSKHRKKSQNYIRIEKLRKRNITPKGKEWISHQMEFLFIMKP